MKSNHPRSNMDNEKPIKITKKDIKGNFEYKLSLKGTLPIEKPPVKDCECFTCWRLRNYGQ